MPNFLSDPPFLLYAILFIGFVVAGAVWYRLRSRKSLIAVTAIGALLGVLILIDRFVESPREESVRRVEAMAAAATARDPTRFVEQIAKSFAYNGKTREDAKLGHLELDPPIRCAGGRVGVGQRRFSNLE